PRRKRAPRSSPSTSAASCTGSKNVAPYFGPFVVASASRTRPDSSSDSSVPDTVGLEIPTRRALSARGRAPGGHARDEPRRAAGELGAAEDEGVRAELLDRLDAGVEALARQ